MTLLPKKPNFGAQIDGHLAIVPQLWNVRNPALQLVKRLDAA